MKNIFTLIVISLFIGQAFSQNNIGINNPTPDASAVLDLSSSNMGFLPPRVADTNAISNPAEGLIIYDMSVHCMRYFNGTIWSDCMGNIVPVFTWSCGYDFIDERDGQSYATVQIGTQCWMAENLNVGIMTPNGPHTQNGVNEKYCYDDNIANCDVYGGLYEWDELMHYNTTPGVKGLCPSGWHVPTDDEWCTLENYVDAGSISCTDPPGFRGTDVGGNLKEAGTSHWLSPNTGATNSSNFTALPAGWKWYFGTYTSINTDTFFWTSTQYDGSYSWDRGLGYEQAQSNRGWHKKEGAHSVRCLKN